MSRDWVSFNVKSEQHGVSLAYRALHASNGVLELLEVPDSLILIDDYILKDFSIMRFL
ncbi:MAG: hypothetical protein ACFFAS_02245 [Promethearchaeota archaeon]